jgi:hypothetical protein
MEVCGRRVVGGWSRSEEAAAKQKGKERKGIGRLLRARANPGTGKSLAGPRSDKESSNPLRLFLNHETNFQGYEFNESDRDRDFRLSNQGKAVVFAPAQFLSQCVSTR